MRLTALGTILLCAACEATMPPPPRAVPEPPPSGKAQLDEADLVAGLAPLQEAIAACKEQYHAAGTPEAIFTIDPSGRVIQATVHRILNISERKCIERALKYGRFPAFSGPEMRVVRALPDPPKPSPDGGAGKG